MSGRSIWILERSCRYVTILQAGLSKELLQSYAIEQQGRRRRDEYQDGVIRTPLKSPSP